MMKTVGKITVVVIIIVVLMAMCSTTHKYTIKATVTSVDNHEVVFTDVAGYEWAWTLGEGEHYTKGEGVTLKMYSPIPDKTTRVLDEIVSVKR